MSKLHLKGAPSNEGARLLGRRVMAAYGGFVPAAARAMRLSVTTIYRLIDGDIVPGEELVADVARATGGGITRAHWRMAPVAGWFDAAPAAA